MITRNPLALSSLTVLSPTSNAAFETSLEEVISRALALFCHDR